MISGVVINKPLDFTYMHISFIYRRYNFKTQGKEIIFCE